MAREADIPSCLSGSVVSNTVEALVAELIQYLTRKEWEALVQDFRPGIFCNTHFKIVVRVRGLEWSNLTIRI